MLSGGFSLALVRKVSNVGLVLPVAVEGRYQIRMRSIFACAVALALAGCGTAPSTSAPAPGPVLQILAPRSGTTVQSPVEVRYAISGMDAGAASGLRLRVSIGDPAVFTSDLPINGLEGTAMMPDDKLITGRHDLRFVLVRTGGSPLAGTQPVIIKDVTIVGRR